MTRQQATELTRKKLDYYELKNWGVRLTTDANQPFLGMCSHKDNVIILNAHHIDMHPTAEIVDTILHEVAHALTPGHAHDEIWAAKAREIGCTNTLPCSHLSFPEHIIDAIRSGATIEMTIEEEVHVIRRPTYKVTRLQEKCPVCGKVGVETSMTETTDEVTGETVRRRLLECGHEIVINIPGGTPFHTMVSNFWQAHVKDCEHDWPTREDAKTEHIPSNQCRKCGEYKLYQFQVVGARFVERALAAQKGCGIFDDMGLGKTVQGLAIPKFNPKYCPFLVVTKSAITFQWFRQIIRWLGPDFLPQIIRTSKDFVMPGLQAYIIPYDLLRRFPREKLEKIGFKLILLDECQQIKNPDSSRTQEVRKLVTGSTDCKVLPLSGTPWKNRGSEFFPVLNMMDPYKFGSHQRYLDQWVEYYWEGNKRKMGGIKNPTRFREHTANLLIRREYNEVMDEFPDINRMKLPVQLDDLSQSTYDASVSEFVEWYNEYVIGGEEDKVSGIEILAKMARMRHITGLAKIPATLGFIEEFVDDTDKKLVVFVHHKDVGELMISALTNTDEKSNPDHHELAKMLIEQGVKVLQYTSAHTGKPIGFDIQETFNNSPRAIMVASTLACGEGLDLQTCADSILHERQWNPQNEDQATPGRFRRIGQKSSSINITVPEAEGTIDCELDSIVGVKRRQYHEVMNTSEMPTWSQEAFARQLAEIIVRKHQAKKGTSGKKTNITSAATLKPKGGMSSLFG